LGFRRNPLYSEKINSSQSIKEILFGKNGENLGGLSISTKLLNIHILRSFFRNFNKGESFSYEMVIKVAIPSLFVQIISYSSIEKVNFL